MKNVVVILAGGKGQRLGNRLPKQFLKVAGKTVIEHTIDVFQKNLLVDEIVIVSNPEYVYLIEEIILRNTYDKVKKILLGGEERYHSSLAAIHAYDYEVNLIFHDAVRPLINDRVINDCIEALKEYNAVDVAIKTTDTIIDVDNSNIIKGIPTRNKLRNGQTPQAFKRSVIEKAYTIALEDPLFETTDDCGVVHKYLKNEKIFVVEGEQFNMKLTYVEDLYLLDRLFQLKTTNSKLLSENNTTTILKDKIVVVFGGSYGIGKDIVELCNLYNVKVYSFSRSENGVDVSNIENVIGALDLVFKKESRIDYVINTAGVLYKEPLSNMSYEDVIKSVNVNYLGAIIVAKESFKYLKQTKGSLLMFTSSSYTRGRSLYSIYSSSKAAIVNLVQALSEEWNIYDIKVNCINPERTKTPMRVKNFGNEPDDSLLKSEFVAEVSLSVLEKNMTGEIVDVKL